MPTNDNDPMRELMPPSPDPHGHAALLLVESLIHGLCERNILRGRDALDIVDRAIEIERESAEAADGRGAPLWRSHALLVAITESLKFDAERAPPDLRPV